jgi:hypothetical protein
MTVPPWTKPALLMSATPIQWTRTEWLAETGFTSMGRLDARFDGDVLEEFQCPE